MKRNVYIYSLVCICLVLFASCEKVVTDVDIPDAKSKLVVYSFISPADTLIRIDVSQSSPAFGDKKSLEDITNATVNMSSGGTSVTATWSAQQGAYIIPAASLSIIAGQMYQLRVSVPDGRNVNATCTVPADSVPVDLAEYLKRPSSENPGSSEYRLLCKWTDKPGTKNYYRVDVSMIRANVMFPSDTSFYYYEMSKGVTDDSGTEGQEQSLLFDQVDLYESSDDYSLEFTLLTTDKAYYDYHESRFRYIGDDPFSEPVIVKSNIEGGLGCFGAYIKTEKRLKL